MHTKTAKRSWLQSFWRVVLVGATALLAVELATAPVSASGDFLGVLKGSPPLSPPFINSPASYDISSGPATVVFTSQVENLTSQVVTVTVDINVHHVLTYYGRNVADGEPGAPGITFKPGDADHTTQQTYGTPFTRTLTVQPKGAPAQAVTFSTVIAACGYYQFDIGKHHIPGGGHDTLSSGFARVLGCNKTPTGGVVGSGGGTVSGSGTSATGGVAAATAGVALANTALPIGAGFLGVVLVLIGGIGLMMGPRVPVRRRVRALPTHARAAESDYPFGST